MILGDPHPCLLPLFHFQGGGSLSPLFYICLRNFRVGGGPHPYILPLFNVQGVVGDIRSPTFNHCSVSREGNPPLYSIYVPFPWSLSLVFYLCSLSRLVVPLYSWLFRLLILIKHELPCDKTNIVTQRCPGSKSYSHRLPAFKRFNGKLKLRS